MSRRIWLCECHENEFATKAEAEACEAESATEKAMDQRRNAMCDWLCDLAHSFDDEELVLLERMKREWDEARRVKGER